METEGPKTMDVNKNGRCCLWEWQPKMFERRHPSDVCNENFTTRTTSNQQIRLWALL